LTHILDNLCADNEARAVIKMSCYVMRAECFLILGDYDSVHRDSDFAIQLFNTMRPTESDRQKPRKNDQLKPQLHLAYARHGQAYESENNALEAIASYRRAIQVLPRGPAHELLDTCLLSYGIPPIDLSDEALKPYSDLMNAISTADDLTGAFHAIVSHVNAHPLDEPTIERLNKAQIPQLFLGVINFQLSSELCVDVGLTLASYFMKRGGDSVRLNHQVIGTILTEYSSSSTIMIDCLHFLARSLKHLENFSRVRNSWTST
jgi:tetratricopeptide (TPR) repeat protein